MRTLAGALLAAVLSSTALVPAAMAQTPPSAAPASAQESRTPAGASFSIPPGWTQQVSGGLVVLNPPESDTRLAIVDVPQAADAKAAIAAGWKVYRGGESHAFKLLTPLPPRNGWDEQAVVQYETSPSEHLDCAIPNCAS